MTKQPPLAIADTFDLGAELSECRTYRYVLWRRWAYRAMQNH